jgi:hypothetical protein
VNTLNSQKRNAVERSGNWFGGSRSTTATRRTLRPGRLRFRLSGGSTNSKENIVDGYWFTSYGRFQRCFCNAERGTMNRFHDRKRNWEDRSRDTLNGSRRTGAICRMLTRQGRMQILMTCGRSSIPTRNKKSSISSSMSVTNFWFTAALQPQIVTNAQST